MADNIMNILEEAIAKFSPGGGFAKSRGEQLETKRGKYTSSAQQSLVSSGLSGTTVGASIPAAFEEDVARPYQTETDLLRSSSLMQALLAKAGFLARQSAAAEDKRRYEEQLKIDADARGYQGGGYAASSGGGGGGGGSTGGGGSFFTPTSTADRLKSRARSFVGLPTGGAGQHLESGSYAGPNAGEVAPLSLVDPEMAKKFGLPPSTVAATPYAAPAGYGTGGSYKL